MDIFVEDAINALAAKAQKANSSQDAVNYSMAAANLANVLATAAHAGQIMNEYEEEEDLEEVCDCEDDEVCDVCINWEALTEEEYEAVIERLLEE